MSRAQRLRDRRHPGRNRAPVNGAAATDEFLGMGRVEQLVLRGDGLTTTSLEILTGDRINVVVDGHWRLTVPDHGAAHPSTSTMHFDLDSPDVEDYLAMGLLELEAAAGELLLIRDVLLVGAGCRVHGSAEVVALLDGLSERVAEALATTDQPIGRLLRDNGVQVTRELQRWGHLPAGRQAARLGEGLTSASRVPARTYLMRLTSTGKPLALLTERFAPHVFR
jgi:chorismate-pyruvate lyase